MSFLFYIDITLNKGVCLIHEGAKIPGRDAKNATALVREFSRNGEQQYLVTQGEKTPKLIFKSKYFTRSLKKNRTLSASEYRNMHENLEHNSMVVKNYNCQTVAFSAAGENTLSYTYHYEEGLVDEIQFLSCKRHENSKLIDKDWSILQASDLMTGGLRSPCPNASYVLRNFNVHDTLGMNFGTFDGIFEYEREKEMFYIESMLCRLANDKHIIDGDELYECGISRTMAKIRKLLNEYRRKKELPQSVVCVNEDFHYMHGKKGCNDDNLKFSKQSWSLWSIFEARDLTTLTLNSTLSLTCDNQDVETLKEFLFKDPFDSCQEFIQLHING